ncbi:MAG: tetratricopeptide repeat protein [Candidatus Acidiferrum sp.]
MRTTGLCIVLILLTAGFAESVRANPQGDQADTTKQANAAYDSKDWQTAARLYRQISETEPKNPRTWFRLATALHEIGEQTEAISAYQKALDAGLPAALGEYQLALVYASMKEDEKSFEFLEKAAAHGFNQPEPLSSDSELAGLRSDARFSKLVEQVKRNQKPCANTLENRQFDFWLGNWDVVTTQRGVHVGSSKIELILGDCVVQENWTSAGNSGYTGKSYNIYDKPLKRWEQYWVDSAGGNIFFYGGLKDGVMDYWTDAVPQPNGTKLKRHLQFFKLGPDTVRQFSQGSTDEGKTWHVEYDFTYNRKKSPAS